MKDKFSGVKLAGEMFKHADSTANWTKDDAIQYFQMTAKIGTKQVTRVSKDDVEIVTWYKKENGGVGHRSARRVE